MEDPAKSIPYAMICTMEKRKERSRWSDNWMKNDKGICLARRKKGGNGK